MAEKSRKKLAPLVVNEADHQRLLALADAALDTMPELAETLLGELERAKVVKAGKVPDNTVQIGSTVSYAADSGEAKQVTLVYPGEANIELNKVSVMTPIGVALIGMAVGHSIDWTDRNGKKHSMTIQSVSSPQ